MRVLYFHQYFSTPDGSNGTRSYENSKRLVASGHQVIMVCGAAAMSKSGLSGPFSNGRREGIVDGIRVLELELPYSNYQSHISRGWTFLRFAWRSIVLALRMDYDIVFATSTPLTAALPGIAASWLRRKPFVFEVRDLWPELPRAMGVIRNPITLRLMDWLEYVAYHSAKYVVALSPGIAQGIRKRGVPENRVVTVPNASDVDLFSPDPVRPLLEIPEVPGEAFVATFTGAHGMANGLGAVLNAAAELRRRGRRDIRFVFIGDGKEKPGLVERARTEGLDNCVFMDPIPKTALAQFLCRRANLGLMILSDVPAFYYGTSPNKFFDYLASALPVLVNYPGWMADMVKEEQIGMVVPPQDASAFADALVRLADDRMATAQMGQRARAFAQREFRRTVLAERCVAVMERAAAGPACRSSVNEASVSLYRRLGKRVLDLLVVAILLPLVLPVIGVVALLIRFRLGSPVFFQQIRPGYGARPFNLLKFRTMTPECSSDGTLLSDEKRLSKFGSLLRRLSLDELPQLWNVIRGDMSLVGPRPLLMQYLDRYTKEQSRRHEVRPGITGWSQVNGRNAITWEEKFALDVWYVEHVTFWLDIQILFKTIIKTTTSKDISQPGHATAEEFWGTRELK